MNRRHISYRLSRSSAPRALRNSFRAPLDRSTPEIQLSLFQSKTSDMVCNKLKETIAYQISTEEVQKWKSRGAALRRGVEESLPVFREKQERDGKVYRPDTEDSH